MKVSWLYTNRNQPSLSILIADVIKDGTKGEYNAVSFTFHLDGFMKVFLRTMSSFFISFLSMCGSYLRRGRGITIILFLILIANLTFY